MPVVQLPAEMLLPDRNTIRDRYLRDYRFRAPSGVDTAPGTQPFIDASTSADTVLPIYADTKTQGANLALRSTSSTALEQRAEDEGLEGRRPAQGATGFVAVVTSSSGATVLAGTEIKDPASGLRFEAIATKLYANGDPLGIRALDTGPGTNLAVGTKLQWTSPPPGVAQFALVLDDGNGDGLTGGRGAETDQELRERIRDRKANPPASGNDVAIQQTAEACPTVAVQKAFTYPAILGSGTYGVTVTLLPAEPGASRIPTSAQLTEIEGWVKSQFPYDDCLFVCALVSEPIDVEVGVSWRGDVASWEDTLPWPAHAASTLTLKITAVTSATVFTVGNAAASYGGFAQPIVGQTIAVFNTAEKTFSRKKIASFTGTGPWVITCETALGASDETWTPIVGQPVCPWSDSLDTLVPAILAYFDGLGPGEQKSSFFDDGLRQKRSPASPLLWPSTIGNRLIVGVIDTDTVQDAELLYPSVPSSPSTGTPGVLSTMYELRYVAAYPQT